MHEFVDEPRATEHRDGLSPNPYCPRCGAAQELVMLERFTGWWCRVCSTAGSDQ